MEWSALDKLRIKTDTLNTFIGIAFWCACLYLVIKAIYCSWVIVQPNALFSVQMIDVDKSILAIIRFEKGETAIVGNDILSSSAATHPKVLYFVYLFKEVLRDALFTVALFGFKMVSANISRGGVPFQKNITQFVRFLGIVIILYGFAQNAGICLALSVVGIGNFHFTVFDIPSAIIGGCLLILSAIFDYGNALQIESDELL